MLMRDMLVVGYLKHRGLIRHVLKPGTSEQPETPEHPNTPEYQNTMEHRLVMLTNKWKLTPSKVEWN